ncbi:MAG: LLM class flavin-dependent oxidoreductase [Halioglobus sp.]|nr:LLM class flavin-dependent oxidoreductase [Halioglobus sp.]
MRPTSVLQFDLRRGPACPDSQQSRYQAALEMVKWADQSGISVVGFSEHHNTEDGFLSSPLLMAAAAAQITTRVSLSVSALLLPLHDPIRVAEDIAVLDLISGGRFMAVVGLGYRELEYQTMGVDWSSRGTVMDEKLEVLLTALRGERFNHRGVEVRLNPKPARPPQSLVCVGGNSRAAARRAARFGLMFAPPIDDPALQQAYDAECEKTGFNRGAVIYPNEPSLTLLSDDPDRAWQEIGEHLLYDAIAYGQWRHKTRRAYAESQATSVEALRAEGKYRILTPEQAVEQMQNKGSINLSPLCGGTPVEFGFQSLELFGSKVLPHFS